MVKENDKDKELVDLGKKLQDFYDSGYVNKKQALGWSVLKGAASGFGAVLGGTIVVALMLWILSAFKQIPLLGPFVDDARASIQAHDKNK